MWAFDLAAVARRNLYLDRLMQTETIWDVHAAIRAFHKSVPHRAAQAIPH
jgi:hypothetical protein